MGFDKHKAIAMAQTYSQQGKWDKAIAEYQGILKADPKSIAIYNTLGDIYLKLGNKGEAIDQYAKLGEAYSNDGLYSKAVAIYKKVQNINPQDYKIYMTLGELYSMQGLLGEAKAQYLAAANYLSRTNQVKEALRVYQKMADLEPGNFTVRVKIGEMYLKEKMVSEAAEQFLQVAQGYLNGGQREEARPYLARVVQLTPKNVEARKILGQIYLERGESVRAAEVLEPVASAAPEDMDLLVTLGDLYLQTQQKEKARVIFEQVVSQNPAHAQARRNLGKYFLQEGNFDTAFTHLDPAAKTLAQNGQFEEAQNLYREILNQNPRYIKAREGLAVLLMEEGQPDKAIPEYKIVAGLYREAGQNKEAANLYRKILEIKPDDVVAKNGLEVLQEGTEPPYFQGAQGARPLEDATTIGLTEEISGLTEELGLPSLEEIPLVVEGEKPLTPAAAGKKPLAIPLEPPSSAVLETKEPISIEGIELVPPMETLEGPREEEVALEEEVTEFTEEDPVIAEHLIEADVYLKYGLTDRAVDLLRGLIEKNPRNLSCRVKLKKIYQDKGQRELVVKESLALAEIFAQSGEQHLAEEELKTILALDPGNSIALLRLKTLKGAPAPGAPVGEEAEIFETLEGVPLELLEPEEIPEELREKAKETVELVSGSAKEVTLVEGPVEAGAKEELDISVDEELALARFYRQQGLKEEAQEVLKNILAQYPQHTGALQELAALEQGAAPATENLQLITLEPSAPSFTPRAEEIPSLAAEEIEEISLLPPEAAEVPIPEIPLPSFELPVAPRPSREAKDITPFFKISPPVSAAESGNFIDIGAELEEEMVETPASLPDTAARALSMDEIFQEFKRGVQQQLSPEDYETHYNLGIAYKEMGLLDEAISEFQLAVKDARRFPDSCSMLGMCFIEKGMVDLAVRQYQKALAQPGLKEENTLSLRFDLGLAYEKMGNLQKALENYMQVYALDAKFRNVANKINAVKNKLAQGGSGGPETGGGPPPPSSDQPPSPPSSGGHKRVSYV